MKSKLLFVLMLFWTASNGTPQDVKWPRQLTNEGSVRTLYQPQVQSWEQHKELDFRMAFSLKPNEGKEALGVLYMKSVTDVNTETHRVAISDMSVSKTNFSSLDAERAETMGNIVRSVVSPDRTLDISLEQIVARTPKEDTAMTVNVNNDPLSYF